MLATRPEGDTMSQANTFRDEATYERSGQEITDASRQSAGRLRRSAQCAASRDFLVATGVSLCIAAGNFAAAQNTAATAEPSSSALEQITVTAEHVPENVQDTPISMEVYGGDTLKRNSITNMQDLTAVAPDVNFANVQGESILTIRGISSRDITENADPAVTVDVDGFYQNREYSLDAMMYDIDRIEVLRGPQGTLNGRNSVGGSINIVTAQPTDTFAAYSSLEYGNYNDLTSQGMVNIPINDEVQLRAAYLSEYHDGYRNNAPEPDGDDADNKSGRLELAFEPFTNFRGLLTVQYTSEGGTGDASENVAYRYTASGALDTSLPPGINPTTFALHTPPVVNLSEDTYRFNLAYDVGGVEFTALGGYDLTHWQHLVDETNPYSTPTVYGYIQNEHPDVFNGEFRIASKSDSPFQWQAGTYFYHESSNLIGADVSPETSGIYDYFFAFVYSTKDISRAAYAQASYQFTDDLKLTAGVRYTSDYKEEMGFYGKLYPTVVYANQAGSAASTKTTYHLALDDKLTAENLLYAKFDTGYKTGGFNFGATSYLPEDIDSYEIGSKNRFLGDTLQLNVAAFYSLYSNEQVSTFTTLPDGQAIALTENAGKSTIYGLETDFIGKVPVLGTFNASVDYLHARFTYFLSVADPSDPTGSGNVNLAGNTLPQAPTLSAQLGLEHSWSVGGGSVTGRIETKLQSSSYFSFYNQPDTEQAAYTTSNAFVSYAPTTSVAGHWKITAFVKNLENSAVFVNADESLYAKSYVYQFYPPRTYGIRIQDSW